MMSPLPDHLVIASRGSRLALAQAERVAGRVRSMHPEINVKISTVTTTGDRDQRAFAQIGGKGLFTSEVEREVAEGRADVAIHSAKDLTAELAAGCHIVCVPERVSPLDVVVGGTGDTGEERLETLPTGATVGTSSMRRRALLAELRPDLEVVEFRGNLDTRLRKVAEGQVAAAILAGAGIERLGADVEAPSLDPHRWVPAPSQGALAVEALEARVDLTELFAGLEDASARAEIDCERAFAAHLEGGCSVPLGCLARAEDDRLVVTGLLAHPEGGQSICDRISGRLIEAVQLGHELADALLHSGGDDILADIRALEAPQVVEP